ncbi:hypothetical protein HK104_008956 [Borealophlyctis nickersoniae]|nr:hypothetical protein HK104_008956 [Borealophlyctis nickersoniae]
MTATKTATVKHRTDYPPKWEYHTIEDPDTALLKYIHPDLATEVPEYAQKLLAECLRNANVIGKYHYYKPEHLGLETATFALGPWGPRRGGRDKWYFTRCTIESHGTLKGCLFLLTEVTVDVKLEFARAVPF